MTNVLVVGLGNMGTNHARVLSDLAHEVRTLDPRMDSGADYSVLSVDLIEWADTVCIATPIDELAHHADLWLGRGKHVLVEKPGATDTATLAYLHQRAEEQGVNFAVGYTERHNPALAALAASLDRIGELRHIAIRRLGYADSSIDPTLNLACHDLDVLAALGFDLECWHALRCDGHVSAHLAPNGLVGHGRDVLTVTVEASHLHPLKVRELEAIGTHGILRVDYQRRCVTEIHDGDDGLHGGQIHVEDVEPLRAEWQAFFAGTGCSDGTKALALVESITTWPTHAILHDNLRAYIPTAA